MRLGEIKAQALMLMGVNNGLNISWSDIDTYKDDSSYATYIHAMNGAINRCMNRMYIAGALSASPSNVMSTSLEMTSMTEFSSDMTDTLAGMIPLYVVGDVFAMEEPSVAQNMRNEFEQLLDEYVKYRAFPAQESIEIVYEV